MEGGRAMDQDPRGLEKDLPVGKSRRWRGFRPWKRHSTILMVVGFLYILIGLGYAFSPQTEGKLRALKVLTQVAPLHFWGGLFMFAGVMAMLSAKWPPFAESWGYMVLTGTSSGWAAAYLLGWAFFDSPTTNLGQSLLWGILAFMWWAISGLPNPERSAVER
jgi:hypothetical protein